MTKLGFLAIAALALGLSGVPAMALPAVPPPAMQTIAPPLITPVKKTFHGNFPGYRGNYYRVPRYNYGHYHNDYRRRYYGDRYYGRRYYGRRYYGRRCYGWDGYYCGPYYGGPFLGFGFGSGIVVTPRRYTYANRHVQWCLNRYRSYNPRNNTWVAYSGRVRQCISPYSR